MDAGGTHAQVADELEKALDSPRLRSSARLGFAPASSSSPTPSGSTVRVIKRKKKTRRRRQRQQRQRQPQPQPQTQQRIADDETRRRISIANITDVVESADRRDRDTSPRKEPSLPIDSLELTDTEEAAAKENNEQAFDTDNFRADHPAVLAEAECNRESGSRAPPPSSALSALSALSAGRTLPGRRAPKRPSTRCNVTTRRHAMSMDLQRLISEVHARPAIWDQKNVNYHNRDVILKMWREIARACEVSTDVAKSKWKHLRDNFRNELKKSYRGKIEGETGVGGGGGGSGGTGAGARGGDVGTGGGMAGLAGTEHDSKWVWFKSLFFLRDQMNSRVIGCNLSQNCSSMLRSSPEEAQIEPQIDILEGQLHYEGEAHYEDLDGDSCQSILSNEDTLHHAMPPPKLNKIGRKRTLMEAMICDYSEERKRYESLEKRLALPLEESEDDTYHFLMSVRNPLRSLPLDRQMFVRLKIQELVYNEINSESQQNRACHEARLLRDVKPPRTGNFTVPPTPSNAPATACHTALPATDQPEANRSLVGTSAPQTNDMSNSASLLQNCTSEGSSDGVSFE